MSEFSESYHLRSNDAAEGRDLLRRAGVAGYVFPVKQGWVTFVAEPNNLEPQERVLRANQGVLLYYVNAEDHGWYFSVYRGSARICHYECMWEDDIEVNGRGLGKSVLYELMQQRPGSNPKADRDALEVLLHPDSIDDIVDSPAYRFAQLMDLPHYEWLSFDDVDHDSGSGASPYREAVRVFSP